MTGIAALQAPWRIGIDVGGTFTDLVLTDTAAVSRIVKVPSVPADPSRGVVAALERLASTLGCSVRDILRDCVLFIHGSTVATNRMLEGKGAKARPAPATIAILFSSSVHSLVVCILTTPAKRAGTIRN